LLIELHLQPHSFASPGSGAISSRAPTVSNH
jgi:hypothetical protein